MKQCTLCFLRNGDRLLLGMKKRGFGAGKWNGFGGKVHEGETLEQAAARELHEESAVTARTLSKVAEITFVFPAKPEWDNLVHVFFADDWDGEPQESEEMRPQWFSLNDVPFSSMRESDAAWLPRILEGKKYKGEVHFKDDNNGVAKLDLKETTGF